MQGATIFVMYTDGTGNVTISARDGNQGHVEPVPDSDLQSGVTLLVGSGVVDGNMVANVHCASWFQFPIPNGGILIARNRHNMQT